MVDINNGSKKGNCPKPLNKHDEHWCLHQRIFKSLFGVHRVTDTTYTAYFKVTINNSEEFGTAYIKYLTIDGILRDNQLKNIKDEKTRKFWTESMPEDIAPRIEL